MKRLLVITLALLMVAPLAFGKKKRDKAGSMDEATYQDNTYDYSLKIHENWRVRIGDDKANLRLVMTQKNYAIPPKYMDAQDYTKVPRVVLIVDTTSLSAMAFIDSIMSTSYKSAFKSTVLKELEILSEPELVTRNRSPLTISGQPGGSWIGQTKFKQDIASSSGSVGGVTVQVMHGGSLVTVKHGNTMLVFHLMCEWEFFDAVQAEFLTMVNSLAFTESPKD